MLRKGSRWSWLTAAVSFAGLVLMLVYPFPARFHPGWLEVTAIDVGQGESLLIAFPDGATMLVDGLGIPTFGKRAPLRMEIGEDVVSPYLWSRGIRRLDYVALTHAHADHAGGLPAVIRNFRPKEIWTGPQANSPEWEHIVDAAREIGSRLVQLSPGTERTIGGVQTNALAPFLEYQPDTKPQNSDSLVLKLVYRQRVVLLTGDAERRTLAMLRERGQVGRIDLLKVAHHGSNTSNDPAFLAAARPVFAIVSAGADNPYHLPSPKTIEDLADVHSMVFRTDRMGAVTVRTDGYRMFAESHIWAGSKVSVLDPF